jgi:hypothetical protein
MIILHPDSTFTLPGLIVPADGVYELLIEFVGQYHVLAAELTAGGSYTFPVVDDLNEDYVYNCLGVRLQGTQGPITPFPSPLSFKVQL